ncbi:ski oncogene-like [Lytechinus pictus]|uniref:ski oncogene-like n=1 Tax=Lytechinus pictus TaxID=7653 RepID=UPI00240E9693|nr:ski oncogene-like [Lytechinus pictus]
MGKDAIITSSWPGSFQRPSAFRPWSPSILNKEGAGKMGLLPDHGTVLVRDSRGMPTYLSMGPPVLLNPERVVPHTAASKFDSQFAPNVALAPPLKLSPSSKESMSPDGEKERDIKCEDLDIHPESTMDQEIEMVKKMLLESDALDTRAGREKLLHELARIRIRQEERLQDALAAKRNYQQEMEFLRLTKKDKMREAMESKRSLRKELDRVRIEYERKLRESNDSRQRLKRDLEQARSRRSEKSNEIGRDNERLVSQNEYLKDRVRDLEEERDQLRRELQRYQHEKADEFKDGEKGKGEKKEEILEKGERLDQSSNRDSSLDCDGQKVVEKKMVEVKKEKEDLEYSEKVKEDSIDRSPPQRDV